MVGMIMPEDTAQPTVGDIVQYSKDGDVRRGVVSRFFGGGDGDSGFAVEVDSTILVGSEQITGVHRFQLANSERSKPAENMNADPNDVGDQLYTRLYHLVFGVILASNTEFVRVFNILDTSGQQAMMGHFDPLIKESVGLILNEFGMSITKTDEPAPVEETK